MTVRKNQTYSSGTYFITFTCYDWLPLIEIADAYDEVYKQFTILKSEGHEINGYVIMPNHLHMLIRFNQNDEHEGFINRRIGTMKRFLGYSIIEKLKAKNAHTILKKLEKGVSKIGLQRNKKHQIFEPSFDCKHCYSDDMILAKLEYMHNNPIKGRWNLAPDTISYKHSSALYYFSGIQGNYRVDHFLGK